VKEEKMQKVKYKKGSFPLGSPKSNPKPRVCSHRYHFHNIINFLIEFRKHDNACTEELEHYLEGSFTWTETPQGYEFWYNFQELICDWGAGEITFEKLIERSEEPIAYLEWLEKNPKVMLRFQSKTPKTKTLYFTEKRKKK
jgi:hypothetical protein